MNSEIFVRAPKTTSSGEMLCFATDIAIISLTCHHLVMIVVMMFKHWNCLYFTIGFNWTIIGNAGEEIVTCEIHSESMNICQNFMSLNLSITLHTLERAQQTWFLRLKVSPNCCNVFQCCQCIARIISYTWYDVKWVCVCWLMILREITKL